MKQACLLIILDGWGIGKGDKTDAIAQANTPNFDAFQAQSTHSTLITYGNDVGLPEGQMGNSEVGHLNIGAGRIVDQELQRINKSIASRDFFENKSLVQFFEDCKAESSRMHFIGLISDGGVHAHTKHALACAEMAHRMQIKESYFHVFTDGRDCAPDSGIHHISALKKGIEGYPTVEIRSITGRYYGMDRDNRWERTKLAYDAMVSGIGEESDDFVAGIQNRYKNNEYDEFLKPIIHSKAENGNIKAGDFVLFFNFRTDRCKQIVRALHEDNLSEYGLASIPNLTALSFTKYSEAFKRTRVAFRFEPIRNGLGEWLSKQNIAQARIAETEKFPHVTSFFNGQIERAFPLEERFLSNSPKVPTYDMQPEMSAEQVKESVLSCLNADKYGFICVNFANTDMVGHTGSFEAAITAAEAVDNCLGEILPVARAKQFGIVIIADHGNADIMVNPDGSVHTAHTTNLVPFIIQANGVQKLSQGKLGDIAPTVLAIMGIDQPKEMTGKCLIQ